MILIQTKAIFIDAYRELNAKKLFWLTLGLNLLVVVLYGALGINEKGVTLLHWTFENEFFTTALVSKELFYTIQFTTWGVPIWLSWATAILALISTAGIIPDMVSGGSIEPILSKPIGRPRLFLTKYMTGLMFVALQVLVFSVGCMLVMGIRGGAWNPSLLLAVPIVLAFFSYLYAFCAFVGLMTRSTIAALLLTILFWLAIWIVNTGDNMMIMQREGSILRVEDQQLNIEKQIVYADKRIAQLREQGKEIPGDEGNPIPDGYADIHEAVNPTLKMSRARLEDAKENEQTWTSWADRVVLVKTLLPKTQETVGLLERHLINDEDMAKLMGIDAQSTSSSDMENEPAFADPRAGERAKEILRNRSTIWVLGTSFAYEALLLVLCCFIFSRRDF